jgi:uncharacterized protein YjbI with pentapeptide repeats
LANPEHLAKLKEGAETWNRWRKHNFEVRQDFTEAELSGANLSGTDLRAACLSGAYLDGVDLHEADLRKADLSRASLHRAHLQRADLRGANLRKVNLRGAFLRQSNLREAGLIGADLREADLSEADLSESYLMDANLSGANLTGANLSRASLLDSDLRGSSLLNANLCEARLRGANLSGANLTAAALVGTDLTRANLTDCHVYGISAWDVTLKETLQSNLRITGGNESPIQVDNLEMAQFIYLLLNNEKIRSVIDTITSKVVLILGRFTPERKVVLNAIRDELRKRDYLPVLFDFEKPVSKDLTGTISTLANLARFVIADLTDPSSVPYELATLVPGTVVPVQTIILEGQREFAMFPDLRRRYHWVLEPHEYKTQELLITHIGENVITPAEVKAKELARKMDARF